MTAIRSFNSKQRGFSLIDAMIAAVVLATGLLALAALQANITRNTADARSRSQIVAFVEEIVERQRAYGVNANFSDIPVASLWTAAEVTTAQNAAGVSALTLALSSTHYDGRTGAFVTPVAAGLKNNDPQYKILRSVATWTDASGQARRLDMTSVLSPRVTASSRLPYDLSTGGGSSLTASPKVRTDSPVEDGMIPIAIGGGSESAATNPRPEISGAKNNERVIETRFDILTYANIGNTGDVLAQSKVETLMVGCTCSFDTAQSTAKAYRPTYWNGLRYGVPEVASYTPKAGLAVLANGAPPESPFCDTCCRDHHDPSGTTGPKVSPLRNSHTHFNDGGITAVTSGVYKEACRLIRVDGFYRVASDLNNNYYNLLRTKSTVDPVSDPDVTPAYVPTATAANNYQNMVLGFLGDKIINNTVKTTYNTALTSTQIAALETANNINDPAKISINVSNDFKWLHSRGLYVDYLEADAVDKIEDAKAKCISPNTLAYCTLKYIPFNTINLSELSSWTPTSGTQLVVTNSDFLSSTSSTEPVRGKVVPGSSPNKTLEPVAAASIYSSNAGVALVPVVHGDETALNDTQVFTFGSGTNPGTGAIYTITIDPSTYVFSASSGLWPAFGANPTATCNSGNPTSTCTTQTGGVPTVVTMGKYNYADSTTRTENAALTCTAAPGAQDFGPQVLTPALPYPVTYCKNYSVVSAQLNGVNLASSAIGSPSPADGSINETTSISLSSINNSDNVTLSMSYQGETKEPSTCTYTTTCIASPNCNGGRQTVKSNYTLTPKPVAGICK